MKNIERKHYNNYLLTLVMKRDKIKFLSNGRTKYKRCWLNKPVKNMLTHSVIHDKM